MKVLLLPEILGELEELGVPEETLNNFTRWLAVNASSTIIFINTTTIPTHYYHDHISIVAMELLIFLGPQ